MEYIKLIILGCIEGITEFMPISSTAHLILAQKYLALQLVNPALSRFMDIFPQLGCALALLCFYRQKIFYLLCNMHKTHDAQQTVWNLVIATAPLILAPLIDQIFTIPRATDLLAINLILGGIIMFLVEIFQRVVHVTSIKEIPFSSAVLIGFAQLLAIFPGVSRSGATIVMALLLHLDRKTAVEFSFLLAIPAIMAASLLEVIQNYSIIFTTENLGYVLVSLAVTFIMALLVIHPLIAYLSNQKLNFFSYYRIGMGLLLLVLL